MKTATLYRLTEPDARAMIERIRWPEGPRCPHCGSENVARLGGKAGEKGQIKCRPCQKKFTVRVGTIFEDSPLPLADWVYAFARMCASKKGVSAHQIHRELGVTYKTAWFMCHRIRHAMTENGGDLLGKDGGTVEVDETYVGGKPRFKGPHNKRGHGTKKTPVIALVERDGRVRTKKLDRVTGESLKGEIRATVDKSARIMTDENSAYSGIGREFAGGHESVKHGAKEYARGEAHINTGESFFALVKRGHYGIFHQYSKHHLHRYLVEHEFKWNNRKVSDEERAMIAIAQAEGKRLTYQQSDRRA